MLRCYDLSDEPSLNYGAVLQLSHTIAGGPTLCFGRHDNGAGDLVLDSQDFGLQLLQPTTAMTR